VVDAPALRIVFFGTPAFAVPSLERLIASRHQVVAVVSQPDRPKDRGQQLQPTRTRITALAHRIQVLQPAKIRTDEFLASVRAMGADLGVVVAYGRILPDALLAAPRLGMINVHASLLPRYRGAAPIQRAVLAGDAETGVTIVRVGSELDAGATFATRVVPIDRDATSGDIEPILARIGADALLPVVDALAAGTAIETPQDHAQATFAPKLLKSEGTIDWTRPADAVHNVVRGLQPWPLAASTLGGSRIVIRRTRPVAANHDARTGTIVAAAGDDLFVACGDRSTLAILELQPEGRKTITARAFLSGRGARAGDRFGS
jgi:methionyl-tRNA formyltransferase